MRRAAFALVMSLMLAPAALAGIDSCQEPYGPVLPDAATVTDVQLQAVKADVLAFIRDSDAYQACLVAAMSEADKSKDGKMTDGQKAAVYRRIDASQKEKEAIGNEYNKLLGIVKSRAAKK